VAIYDAIVSVLIGIGAGIAAIFQISLAIMNGILSLIG